MYKKSILDKQEWLICEIIEILALNETGLSKKALCEQLGVSETAVKVALLQLDEDFNSGDTPYMIIKKNNVQLVGKGKINFNEKIYDYIKKSINYQILMAFYTKGNGRVENLGAKLNVSEASVFRRIKRLTPLLEGFNLKIAQGVMLGDESQIRFFYYSLFLGIDFKFEESIENGSIMTIIERFEEYFDFNVNDSSLVRVKIWLKVTSQRMTVNDQDNHNISSVLEDMVTNNSLFDSVEEEFGEIIKQFKDKVDVHFESALLYAWTIAFVSVPWSTFVAHDFVAINRRNNNKLQQAVEFLENGFEKSLGIQISGGELSESLYPICTEAFCFHGILKSVSTTMMETYRVKSDNALVRKNVEEAMDAMIEEVKDQPEWHQFYLRYGVSFANSVMEIFNSRLLAKEQLLTVGVDLNTDERVKDVFIMYVSQLLNGNLRVNLDVYDSNRNYDLVVTNFMNKNYLNSTLEKYIITGLGTDNDVTGVEQKLTAILKKYYHEN